MTKVNLFVIITFAEREYLRKRAAMAQLVEHILGKDEVPSSNLGSSSKTTPLIRVVFFVVLELLPSRTGFLPTGKNRFVTPASRLGREGGIWVCAARRNMFTQSFNRAVLLEWCFLSFWS